MSVVCDLPFLQRPFPEKPHECPDQRVYDLLVGKMLRVQLSAKLLNRSRQQVVLEHSRILLLQEIVKCDKVADSSLKIVRVFGFPIRLHKEVERSDLRIID